MFNLEPVGMRAPARAGPFARDGERVTQPNSEHGLGARGSQLVRFRPRR